MSIPEPTSQKRILFGISFSWGRYFLAMLLGILQAPVLFANLENAELGIWFLFFSFSSFLALTDLGLSQVLGRAVSYLWGKDQDQERGEQPEIAAFYGQAGFMDLLLSALSSFAVIVVLGGGLSWGFLRFYLVRLGLGQVLLDRLWVALPVFLLGALLQMLANILLKGLSGLGDVDWENSIRGGSQAVWFALLIVFVPRYPNIITLCILYVIRSLAMALLAWLCLKLRHAGYLAQRGRVQIGLIRRMLKESWPIFVTQLGAWFILEINLVVAGAFFGAEVLPNLAILRQMIQVGITLAAAIPIAVQPFASAAFSVGDEGRVRMLYMRAVRLALVIGGGWMVGVLVWPAEILDLWVGAGHFLGYSVLIPLVVTGFLEFHHVSHSYFVWSAGKWPFAPWALAAGVLNVIFISVGSYFFGLEGLVLGTMLAQMLTNNWYAVYYPLRQLGMGIRKYFQTVALLTIAYLAVVAAAALGLKFVIERVIAHDALSLLAGALLTAGVGLLAAWILVAAEEERAAAKNAWRELILRTRKRA
ncbi:hypothetical protein ACFLYP_00885 [Chloroflexota bacterium]